MPEITSAKRTVYRSASARRDYLTLHAACAKEASMLVAEKYPTDVHWHFTEDPKLVALRDRIARALRHKFRAVGI